MPDPRYVYGERHVFVQIAIAMVYLMPYVIGWHKFFLPEANARVCQISLTYHV
jgi:hypothetical protein